MTERLLTIMFTDVEGSTALHSARGDKEAQEILHACDEVVRKQVQAYGGRPIKSLGDGLMASFDSPRRAVNCALAIQSVLSERARRQPRGEVRVRLGLHTGEVAEEDGDLFGQAVNAAARVAARARGGEVLVSGVVRQLCGEVPDTEFEDRGRQALKGFPDRWRLYRVTSTLARPGALGAGERTPFVGRTAERAELRSRIERALGGQGGLVLIGGEPGVGKSRLCLEVAEEARRLGLLVLTGHCYQREGDLPYMPWVEMVETVIAESAPAALLEALGDSAPEMARLVPQLRRLFPEIPPPVELPPDQQRRFTFTSLTDYVTRVSRLHPRLYVLEDLHWADDSTLLFLAHLSERLPTIPVLVLGTYRDPQLEISPILQQTLAGLIRERHVRLLSVRRHERAEVEALLRGLSGQPPPEAVVAAIHAETEGNAFFVEEVFRHLAEMGRLLDNQGHFRGDLRIEELDVPENVRLVTGQRLDRLTESTRKMLMCAAVVGRRFGYELLEAVTDLGEGDILDAVDEAERAQLVAPDRASLGTYWFSHELVRHALLTRLTPMRRQRQHLRIADALERVYGDELELHASDIAHHLVGAGATADRGRTARFLTMAGDRALGAAAHEEALRNFDHALRLLPATDQRGNAELLVRLGTAQRSLGRWEDAMATWTIALPALEAVGDVEAAASLAYDLSYQLAWTYRATEALAIAERGLASISGATGPHKARLLATTAICLAALNRFDESSSSLEQARALLLEIRADPSLVGEIEFAEVFHGYAAMQMAQGVAAWRRAVQTLRDAGSLWHLATVLSFFDAIAVSQGLFRDSREIERELYPLAARLGHMGAACITRRNEFPRAAAESADLTTLDALARTQAEAVRNMGAGWRAYASTLLGIVKFWSGDWTEAQVHMEEGERLAVPGLWFGPQHGYLCLLNAYAGRSVESLALFAEAAHALPDVGRANMIGRWNLAILASEAFGVLGDTDRARQLYPLVVEALATGTVMRQYDGALIQRAAGMAAVAAGLRDDAEKHFETALRQAEELPHLMERPHVRHFYASFLMDRGATGDLERARLLLDEGLAGYRSIGMPRHEAMARSLRARLG